MILEIKKTGTKECRTKEWEVKREKHLKKVKVKENRKNKENQENPKLSLGLHHYFLLENKNVIRYILHSFFMATNISAFSFTGSTTFIRLSVI